MNRNRSRGLACFRRIALLALLWLTACCVFARESKAAALVDDSFANPTPGIATARCFNNVP